jgi:hypothetical protein
MDGVAVGKNLIVGVACGVGDGMKGTGVDVGIGGFDGEQAAMIARSVSRNVSRFTA